MSIYPPLESDMQFGPFEEEFFIHWEETSLSKKCGEGFKCVEYICLVEDGKSYQFIEARKTAPNPDGSKGQERFDEYIDEIKAKFADSTELLFAHLLSFHSDTAGEIPPAFALDMGKEYKIKYVFVVKESQKKHLAPIKTKLTRMLMRQRKLWKAEIVVFNAAMAATYGLIQSIEGTT
jgi:hypothetical protein